MKTLAEAIAASNAADEAFEAAIKAAGYKSRWDWSKNDNRPRAAYEAKVAADAEMHFAFERSRN